MSEEKKIVFGAVNNVSKTIQQIDADAKKTAQSQASSLKEQIFLYEKQIALIKQKYQLEQKGGKTMLENIDVKYGQAKTPQERSQVAREYDDKVKSLEQGKEILAQLKDIASSSKKELTIAAKAENENKRENDKRAKYENLRQAREEVRTDKKGVIGKINKAEKEGYGDMSSEEIERLNYQKSQLGSQSSQSSMFKQIISAEFFKRAFDSAGQMAQAQTGMQGATALSSGVANLAMSSKNPYIMAAGGVLSLFTDLYKNTEEKREALALKYNPLVATSGREVGLSGNTKLGYSNLEGVDIQRGLLTAAGSSKNLVNNANSAMLLERGAGISQSTIVNIVEAMRSVRSNIDIVGLTSRVIKNNPELVSDRTNLSAILENTASFVKNLAGQTENVDLAQTTGIMGALRGVGGTFSDPSLGMKNLNSINQSLTNPQNDFQKARAFSTLSSLNPNASYFQLLEMQEKGVSQKGYLSSTLSQLKSETGGGENLSLSIMSNLGLGASTSRKLAEAYEKNPNRFTNFSGAVTDDEVNKILGEENAANLTTRNQREAAEKTQADLGSMGAINGALKGLENTLNYLGDAITGNQDKNTSRLVNAIDKSNGVTDK